MARWSGVLRELFARKHLGRNLSLVLGLVLVFLAFQRFYLKPRQERIASLRSGVESLSREMGILQNQLEDRKARAQVESQVLEAYRVLEERLGSARQRLPARENVSGLLRSIAETGKRSGVRLLSIIPETPLDRGRLLEIPFRLQMAGRYRDIGAFLFALESLDRLVVLGNLQLASGEGGEIQAQFQASTFLLKEMP